MALKIAHFSAHEIQNGTKEILFYPREIVDISFKILNGFVRNISEINYNYFLQRNITAGHYDHSEEQKALDVIMLPKVR